MVAEEFFVFLKSNVAKTHIFSIEAMCYIISSGLHLDFELLYNATSL